MLHHSSSYIASSPPSPLFAVSKIGSSVAFIGSSAVCARLVGLGNGHSGNTWQLTPPHSKPLSDNDDDDHDGGAADDDYHDDEDQHDDGYRDDDDDGMLTK